MTSREKSLFEAMIIDAINERRKGLGLLLELYLKLTGERFDLCEALDRQKGLRK